MSRAENVSLSEGTRLGAYEITGQIGAGGMGEIYRAVDSKLGRDVAIKILPAALASDRDRLARFEREAKLLAALNHPHIASVYSLDEHQGTLYLAMELVEGDTLEEKLKPGAMPVEDTLSLGLQIAEALEAAHGKGVIHRDLKPANVMVTQDGIVKVLDFGLAKVISEGPDETNVAQSPALSMAMTQQGLVLGTAGYMSPEQASGQPTDQRADVWAFGVVLYEMLTGLPLFSGESVPHILADVLKTEPNWNRLPANLHPRLKLMLERCLTKKPRNRLHSIADARIEIEAVLNDPVGPTPKPTAQTGLSPPVSAIRRIGLPVGLMAVAAAAALVVGAWIATRFVTSEPVQVTRFPLRADGVGNNNGMAWSPDGSVLVYSATVDGIEQLFVRRRDQFDAVPLRGTEGAVHPFFAPDGESVGFFAEGELRRVALEGGLVRRIAEVGDRRGASWGPDGTIVYASSDYSGLMRVPEAGGEPEILTVLGPEGGMHMWPRFLPDGSGILFTIFRDQVDWDLAFLRLDSDQLEPSEYEILIEDASDGTYLPSGHLVFARTASLWAVGFDLENHELVGNLTPVVAGVQVNTGGWALYSVARDGSLAYLPGETEVQEVLTWVDRDGNEIETVEGLTGDFSEPRIEPNGGPRIAVARAGDNPESSDIYVIDRMRGNQIIPLTFDGAANRHPLWLSSDRLLFSSPRDGFRVYSRATDGSGSVNELTPAQPNLSELVPTWASSDGSQLLATMQTASSASVGYFEIDSDSGFATLPLSEASHAAAGAVLSPNGRWMAYVSNETGRNEVWAVRFPELDMRTLVSTNGGNNPVWLANGEIVFSHDTLGMQVVRVTRADDEVFQATLPEVLFREETHSYMGPRDWDVTADGQEFLMTRRVAGGFGRVARRSELHIVANWQIELNDHIAPVAPPAWQFWR